MKDLSFANILTKLCKVENLKLVIFNNVQLQLFEGIPRYFQNVKSKKNLKNSPLEAEILEFDHSFTKKIISIYRQK